MSNQMVVTPDSGHILLEAVMNGADVNNVLATGGTSYTAIQDCWLASNLPGSQNYGKIDGVTVHEMYQNAYSGSQMFLFPLKKGQQWSQTAGSIQSVFALKR